MPTVKNSLKHHLPIVSQHNNRNIYITWYLWVLLSVIVLFAHCPDKSKDSFNTLSYLNYLWISLLSFWLITLNIVRTRYKLVVDREKMELFNVWGKVVEVFWLKNITRFVWDNRPRRRSSRGGGSSSVEHQSIEISFSDKEEPIYLDMERYANFSEIRCYLYDYCLENGIIKR